MTVKSVDGIWARLQRVVLPPHCLLCGDDGEAGRDLCLACAASLVRNPVCCPRCALPLGVPAPACGECLHRQPPFEAAFAPFLYAHPLDLLMTRLKFGRSLAAGRVLSGLWSEAITQMAPVLPTLFVPVPLHASRLRERGYNQAFELLRPLARSLKIPLAGSLLRRTRATPAQANLDASARRRNLRGAFEFHVPALRGVAPAAVHVALVDDVMTTGATLHAAAKALRKAGVGRVDAWVCARVP
ncbi:MAG TPA: ComF family protein [Rudaea sp.]|nr:ComF family protein [Rudaea sp.]